MIADRIDDIRLARSGRYLASKGHEVFAVGRVHTLVDPFLEIAPWGGMRRLHPRRGRLMETVERHLEPDIVWCHDLAGLWRYASSATLTDAIQEQILEGAELSAIEWFPIRNLNGRTRLVYDAHEWERDRSHMWHRERHLRDWIERERRCVPLVDRIVTVTEELADLWMEQTDYRPVWNRPAVVTNAPFKPTRPPMREALRKDFDARASEARRAWPILAFSGSPTPDRDLSTLASCLQHGACDLRVAHFGAGELASALGGEAPDIEQTCAYPWPEIEDRPTLLDHLAACDVAFSGGWIDFAQWRCSGPNKMYEYAFAGVPQVAPRGKETFARLNAAHGIGAVYEMGSARSLERALDSALATKFDREAFVEAECFEHRNGPVLDALLETLR